MFDVGLHFYMFGDTHLPRWGIPSILGMKTVSDNYECHCALPELKI